MTINKTFLRHDGTHASLAVVIATPSASRVRSDVGYGGMRWITVHPADQPGTSISGRPVRL
jgi:hypothetical protein